MRVMTSLSAFSFEHLVVLRHMVKCFVVNTASTVYGIFTYSYSIYICTYLRDLFKFKLLVLEITAARAFLTDVFNFLQFSLVCQWLTE